MYYQERDQLVALSTSGNLLLLGASEKAHAQAGDCETAPWVILLRMKFASGAGMQVARAKLGQ
jgi:hypothetical protein